MAIKIKNYYLIYLVIIIMIAGILIVRLPSISPKSTSIETPKTSSTTIVDKVYTFLAPGDTLSFEDMALKEDYMYYIFLEVVTPHSCELNVTLWDPQNKQYDIFSSNLTYFTEGYERVEIPFGTALGGNYTFLFSMELQFNLNLYLRMEEGDQCLRDMIPSTEWNKMIFYRVTQFDDGEYIEHNIQLESDVSYKFYFGRVSPIASEDNKVLISNNLTDPNEIEFHIYTNFTLVPIHEIQEYNFGTSEEGVYSVQLEIKADVQYINLAYAIIEDYVISENDDNNQTGTPSNSTSYDHGAFSVPVEMTILLTISIGSIVALLGVIIYYRNHRRSSAINLSQY